MLLDADDAAGRGVDERLHESIVGAGGRDQPLPESIDALMVVAVHPHISRAEYLGERGVVVVGYIGPHLENTKTN